MNCSKLSWRENNTPQELQILLNTLAEEYPINEGGRGLKLKFQHIESDEQISRVVRARGEVTVEYSSISTAARGIGSALAKLDGEEKTPFRSLGIMLDVSRGMVMRVEQFKKWLRRLALAGYNQVLIYSEDTYELDGEPFFGYQRGAYSLEELQELDSYAKKLGIELIGCIQTLAHMAQILKWDAYLKICDTTQVMMVDEPKTYELVEKMLSFWSQALSSHRIHIGMDEAWDLGRGRYQTLNGPADEFDMMTRHLNKVCDSCEKLGLTPMIWSDMFFRLGNDKHNYYDSDSPFPEKVVRDIPSRLDFVYWDYYHKDEETYSKMIKRHRDLGKQPIVGSGIWTWSRLWYDHYFTKETAIPCISACRKENVEELFFTMWGDDGAFCHYDSSLAGIVFCGDRSYGENDENRTAKRFEAICGANYAAQVLAGDIHRYICVDEPVKANYQISAAMLLWDDPLLGIYHGIMERFDPDYDLTLLDKYEEILCQIMPEIGCSEAGDIEYAVTLIQLLIKKIELRGALEVAYDNNDFLALRELATTHIPATINALDEFDANFRRQWMTCAKAQGLERIQARNAGLRSRLEETALRIREYLNGSIDNIEELESRLPISAPTAGINRYKFVSSANWWI